LSVQSVWHCQCRVCDIVSAECVTLSVQSV